jgi:hypothetical protein
MIALCVLGIWLAKGQVRDSSLALIDVLQLFRLHGIPSRSRGSEIDFCPDWVFLFTALLHFPLEIL